MDLQKEYEKLYQHWLKEFQNTDLTELSQDTFNNYIKILNFINEHQEKETDAIKQRIFDSYKDNINYLFNDLLKIREIKIINSALALHEIYIDKVIESEKLLYENLVSSIKGYQKVLAISLFKEDHVPSDILIEPKAQAKSVVEDEPILKEERPSIILDYKNKDDQEKVNYTLIRFLRATPPLVGVDLINYGPFGEEDIANLPQENAKILIIEKFAEKIELP